MGEAGFSLLSLGPELWLRFEDYGLADDAAISTATDLTGNGNDWTQGTADNQPVFKTSIVNGLGVARFGANDFLSGPDLSGLTTAGEVFVVIKITDQTVNVGLWDLGSAADAAYYPVANVILDDFGSTTRQNAGDPTPSLEDWRLYNVVSTGDEWTAFLDGTQLFTTGTNTVGFPAAPVLGRNSDNVFLVGDIAELILFDRKLAGGEKDQVEAYIASRYALTIA